MSDKIKVRIQRWDNPDEETKYEAHVLRGEWPMRHWSYCGSAATPDEAEALAVPVVHAERAKRARRAEEDRRWRLTRCTHVKTFKI